ncbi:putative membrane protein [Acinetobacter phage BS46]|nr:putative membrane protein [Acinetobacter phage BS46]
MLNKFIKAIVVGLLTLSAVACTNDAQVASSNLSQAADNFQLNRRVVFYNGITGDYMLTIEGKCSLKADGADNQLEVTCKTGENSYKKHFLGLSDNISYFSEQIDGANVSVYHYKVTFKPEVIIPDIDLKTSVTQ